jgi:hypothetical protein
LWFFAEVLGPLPCGTFAHSLSGLAQYQDDTDNRDAAAHQRRHHHHHPPLLDLLDVLVKGPIYHHLTKKNTQNTEIKQLK